MNPVSDPSTHDAALMRRIAQRDEAALAQLYDRYAPLLYSLALRMVAKSELAEEVLQDVFLSVWRSARTWEPEKSPLQAWLAAVTRHRAVDALRKARASALPLEADMRSDDPGPDETLLSQAASREVREAVAALPQKLRDVLEVAYSSGLTHREAAEKLGIPQGTVKSRLRLALARVGRRLRARGLVR